jgi:hypothetical protein
MSKYSPSLIWFVLLFGAFNLGMVFGTVGGTYLSDSQGTTKCEAQVTKWKTKYKTLRKQKNRVITIPVYKYPECDAALEACEGSLTAIKHWCDPECKQQLAECLESLQAAYKLRQEMRHEFYSREF